MNSRDKYLKQHKDYIRKRELEHIKNKITDDKKYRAELQKLYNYTQDEIQRRLERLYIRYAKSEGITIDEAMKLADKTDIEKFINRVKEYVKNKDFSKTANDELKLYNLKMRMSRLELMKHEILIEQMRLSGKETDMLYGRLKDDLIEETRRQAGILGLDPDFYEDFIRNSDAIINGDFKSAKFSDRIWANGYKMRGNLQSGIHNSMLLGDNPRTWARKLEENLSEEMDDTGKQNAFYNAFRLAVTESARVQINTGLNLMRKSGYEKYIWIAEPGACHICAPFNNHVFDIENSDIGDELPPMHPFCRCSIAAYYNMDEEEIDIGEKAREIAEELGYNPLSDNEVVPTLRRESIEWIEELSDEEKRAIEKYTYNGKDSDGLRLFEKINGYLENRYEPVDDKEKEIILRNAYNINHGLLKNDLKHDIIVYRNDYNPDTLEGEVKKFLSTSVTKKGAIFGNPNTAIIVPKNSNGAYIENLANLDFKRQREFLLNRNTKLEEVYSNNKFIIFRVK